MSLRMRMSLSQRLTQKLELKMSIQQRSLFASILEMTNEQLFRHLKEHEGTGETYPAFSIDKFMGVPRQLDVWVNDGIIHEASSNYITYPDLNGSGSGKKMFATIRWMLKVREEWLRVITAFILRQHHAFFWGDGRIHPISMVDAVQYINNHPEVFFLNCRASASMLSRVVKNKMISVEGKDFPMRMFFSTRTIHPEDIKAWFRKVLAAEDRVEPLSDAELVRLFSEQRGITLARRTVSKYRNELNIPNSEKRRRVTS